MQFEWDESKNRINKAKHGISFETAIAVWNDPFHWSYFDRIENGEQRMHCVGTIGTATILLVVYMDKDGHGEEIIRIIGARRATRHEDMPTRTIRLTADMQAEIDMVAAIADDNIDTSDIAEAPLENMMAGERGRYFRPYKTSITIRLDADLLDWFKAHSENGGYQTKINSVLRRHMVEAIKSAG